MMNFIVLSTLIFSLSVEHIVAIDPAFVEQCRIESQKKREFDEEAIDGYEKSWLWKQFLDAREDRIRLGARLDIDDDDCSSVAKDDKQVMALSNERLFYDLCVEEKLMELNLKSFIPTGIKLNSYELTLHRRESFGKSIRRKECPTLSEDSISPSRVFNRFSSHLDCKREVYYGYMNDKMDASAFYDIHAMRTLQEEVYNKKTKAERSRNFLCKDKLEKCCSETLMQSERLEAIAETARRILETTDRALREAEESVSSAKLKDNWNELFDKVCRLESKTNATGSSSVKASELKKLHKQTKNYRKILGSAIGKDSCPSSIVPLTEKVNEKDEERSLRLDEQLDLEQLEKAEKLWQRLMFTRTRTYEILVKLEKAYKKELNEALNPEIKKQTRLAYELVKDKRTELETSSGVKNPKFQLLHPSTW